MVSMRSHLLSSSKFSQDDLERIAIFFRDMLTDIERVCVYQSKGSSSGAFVLVISDESICNSFIKISSECLKDAEGTTMNAEEVRFKVFEKLWPQFTEWRKKQGMTYGAGAYFDILICPRDWQSRASELAGQYYHSVPFYLRNIAASEPLLMT